MPTLNLRAFTFDPGLPVASPAALANTIAQHTLQAWQQDADIVLWPEYTWLALEQFTQSENPQAEAAHCFWNTLWPDLQQRLAHPNKAVVLGSTPSIAPDGSLRNRAPILAAGKTYFQDKLHLTPWESQFSPGDALQLIPFRGQRIAVLICLDIEIPELAAALRTHAPGLILVPSATETILGMERVTRCASARAVELGCFTAVSPLVGRAPFSDLIDENLGCLAVFMPSQSPFADLPRLSMPPPLREGIHALNVTLDFDALAATRVLTGETAPFLIHPRSQSSRLTIADG